MAGRHSKLTPARTENITNAQLQIATIPNAVQATARTPLCSVVIVARTCGGSTSPGESTKLQQPEQRLGQLDTRLKSSEQRGSSWTAQVNQLDECLHGAGTEIAAPTRPLAAMERVCGPLNTREPAKNTELTEQRHKTSAQDQIPANGSDTTTHTRPVWATPIADHMDKHPAVTEPRPNNPQAPTSDQNVAMQQMHDNLATLEHLSPEANRKAEHIGLLKAAL